ncbi:MAG: glutathione S-transferase N-terminal domain-containing protein [Bdellovibrionales bacterium]|nr:glutathione S-transferase N-terminal domain-containing protein [Bdellovibrionales bacterium]
MKLPDGAYELHKWVGRAIRPIETARFAKLRTAAPEEVRLRSEKLRGCELYHFQVSPFAARVRRALAELQVEIPIHDVLEDDAAFAALMRGGRRDQVPCLKIARAGEPERWLYESREIVRFLKETVGSP